MVSIMKEHDKNFLVDFGRQLLIKLSLIASRRLMKFKNKGSCVTIIKPIDLFSWKEIEYAQLSLNNLTSRNPIFSILQILIFSKILQSVT